MNATLEQAQTLKQALVDFVLDAEGDLAEALETYAAEQARRKGVSQDLIIDMFLTEGRVGDKTPIALFIEDQPDLGEADRQLVLGWEKTFTGLFAVEQVMPDGFELVNWLTEKHYPVKPTGDRPTTELARLKPGEIVLTRISPLNETDWIFSGPLSLLGKLGKPKLAVAIGNFKDNHKQSLYGDAPDLLEEAWQSVEKYHLAFLDFFGSEEITLPGYQLNKQMGEFREVLSKRFLADAGIDDSKSLAELAAEAGIDEEEMAAVAEESGADAETISKVLASKGGKMAAPQVQLPDELKKAEQVTVLAHPKWGQMFLPHHTQFKAILESEDWQTNERTGKLVRQYLQAPEANFFVWQQLAEQYPQRLEEVLQTVLARPDFQLKDLAALLRENGKPTEPELPEIASVPIHLHNLFEAAMIEVNKSSKSKGKKAKKSGFGKG
ncbi:hypothetical protein H6F88_02640 [Oculatella sp. FACHB-28]|uniref:hypothetical protein n=1 Tax=Oculatella sp. FACHB-28 TaxID=2692845 RepID=UPI0016895807|nr:hypothetical protein [Oculatella sp. FACHB-28]